MCPAYGHTSGNLSNQRAHAKRLHAPSLTLALLAENLQTRGSTSPCTFLAALRNSTDSSGSGLKCVPNTSHKEECQIPHQLRESWSADQHPDLGPGGLAPIQAVPSLSQLSRNQHIVLFWKPQTQKMTFQHTGHIETYFTDSNQADG